MASPFDLHKFDLQPWCSLLPYLFIIVVEALNVANKNAMKSSLVEGIVLPRWDSWHNNDQYGDDACFTTWVIEIRIQAWHAGAAEEPIWVGWRTFNAYGYNTWTLASYLALFFFCLHPKCKLSINFLSTWSMPNLGTRALLSCPWYNSHCEPCVDALPLVFHFGVSIIKESIEKGWLLFHNYLWSAS